MNNININLESTVPNIHIDRIKRKQQEDYSGHILLVDDVLANLRVLSAMLKNRNYKVRKATDGRSAIEAINIEQPDLVLLDIQMPEMDGYEVCQCLKSNDQTKDIPVIFISALNETLDKVKAFKVGAADYITKPFQEEEVLARIASQLTIIQQSRLLQEEHNLLLQEQEKLKQEIAQRKEAEAILYQSRALISSILNNSSDGIAALEAVRDSDTRTIKDFRFLVVNPMIASALGQDSDSLIGKLLSPTLKDLIDSKVFEDFCQIVETGKPLMGDFSDDRNQTQHWYNFIAVKLADGISITIRDITERKKFELELNHLAEIDGLTGIYNRRSFDLRLEKEWRFCQREGQVLSLILCDVDYFKLYNDHYGHQAGDECLKQVAKTINDTVKRPRDIVARYGGEEFAVILPNTDPKSAVKISEEIRTMIEQLQLEHLKSQVSNFVSLSLGVTAILPNNDLTIERFIEQADAALYQGKKQGRNQTTLFQESM